MNTTEVVVILLVVITAISLVALYRNKNLRNRLRLPGVDWDFQASDRNQTTKGKKDQNSQSSEVDLGKDNLFEDDLEQVAGRDIESQGSKESNSGEQKSSVDFGQGNTFAKKVKKVAGRDIHNED